MMLASYLHIPSKLVTELRHPNFALALSRLNFVCKCLQDHLSKHLLPQLTHIKTRNGICQIFVKDLFASITK